jgi:hypothetical protein
MGALVLTDPGERHRIAVLVVRRDRDHTDEALPDDWLVLAHEGVARGSVHRMANRGALASLPVAPRAGVPTMVADDHHTDPVPGFEGRWLAGVAAVPGTPLAVVVQTRYDAAIAPNQRLAVRLRNAGLLALVLALLACVGVWVAARARSGP